MNKRGSLLDKLLIRYEAALGSTDGRGDFVIDRRRRHRTRTSPTETAEEEGVEGSSLIRRNVTRLPLLLLLMAAGAHAVDERRDDWFTVTLDNDAFLDKDAGYTNGVGMSWVHAGFSKMEKCISLRFSIFHFMLAILTAVTWSDSANAAGEANAGAKLAIYCAYCHGTDGNPIANGAPRLAGQSEEALVAKMKAFRQGHLNNLTNMMMVAFLTAGCLNDQDIENLAAFYATRPNHVRE